MIKNIFLLCVSLTVTFLCAEGVMRLVFDPVDFLSVKIEEDSVLNHRIGGGVSGHDEWGYRNARVPDGADVLAIGDSMTYGLMAKSFESWPAVLQKQIGRNVYNASLGGYGPLHYLHILRTRAPELSPKAVVVMVYIGNDIMDTYNLAYSNENWAAYRQADSTDVQDAGLFVDTAKPKSFTKRMRNWLSQNSILYRLVTQNALFDFVRQREKMDDSVEAFQYQHLGSPVTLVPTQRLKFIRLEDPRIVEGIHIIERALTDIAAYCAKNGTALHVAIMPVREQVFYEIAPDAFVDQGDMKELHENHVAVQARLEQILQSAAIEYTDLLPLLETALSEANIYPPADGHPNALGYDVVATKLAPIVTALLSEK